MRATLAVSSAGGKRPRFQFFFRQDDADRLDAVEMTEWRVLAALAAGDPPGPASPMLKTQTNPDFNAPGVGPEHALITAARCLYDRAASIHGGSNEIQRDIMAKLVLGL